MPCSSCAERREAMRRAAQKIKASGSKLLASVKYGRKFRTEQASKAST